jgi:hypothetical protein
VIGWIESSAQRCGRSMKTLTIQITSRLPADVAARLRALVDRDVELTTKIALREGYSRGS